MFRQYFERLIVNNDVVLAHLHLFPFGQSQLDRFFSKSTFTHVIRSRDNSSCKIVSGHAARYHTDEGIYVGSF